MENKNIVKIIILMVLVCIPFTGYAQSDSRYNAEMNLPFNEKAGDVNPQTGDITLSATDVSLPGRAGMNFSYGRIWNTTQSGVFNMVVQNKRNSLDSNTIEKTSRMGVGWRSSVPFIDRIVNDDFSSLNLFFGGGVYQIDEDNLGNKTGKVSNLMGYDLLDLIIYTDHDLEYSDVGTDIIDGFNYSGLSINKDRQSEYALVLKDKSRYWFDSDGKLMMHQDKTGINKIWYFYDTSDRLKLVLDTIGREIEFCYSAQGNLSEIKWAVSHGSINGESRTFIKNSERSVKYGYGEVETTFPGFDWTKYKNGVEEYRTPYILVSVQNPLDQISGETGKENETSTRYDYEAASSKFSFFDEDGIIEETNMHMLVAGVTSGYSDINGEKFLNKRVIEYSHPKSGKQRKDFYNGFMENFRISKQYYRNRHNDRDMMPTTYTYIEAGEQGYDKSYQTVITMGNIDTRYIYTLSGSSSQNNVLYSIKTGSDDGFNQEKIFEYNMYRTKTREFVKRNGTEVYSDSFKFDSNGNLTWSRDRQGLEISILYFEDFNVPRETIKRVRVDNIVQEYKTENTIDEYGRVVKQTQYLENGAKEICVSTTTYDTLVGNYGNAIRQTDYYGNEMNIEYDSQFNCFPVRNYSTVEIPKWDMGIENGWTNNHDTTENITVQNLRKYNSDGTVWIEVDNDGFAIEHYYNVMGQEIRTVNPDFGDVKVTDLENETQLQEFLTSREHNPGASMEIHYQDGLVKTTADINKTESTATTTQKVTGVQTDGLEHTESEIEYGNDGIVVSSNSMTYDIYGRMVAMTDADASEDFVMSGNHDTPFKQHDKTWIIKYDDLSRQVMVVYPITEKGAAPGIKMIAYDDYKNRITTIDPERRKVIQQMDWAGNLTELESLGDYRTDKNDYQTYKYEYDELGRKTLFTDPKGIQTAYYYDERDLLVEQRFLDDKNPGIFESDIMEYNYIGQLVKKTDRKGQIATFTYDTLGRNTELVHYRCENDLKNNNIYYTITTAYDHRGNAVRIDNQNLIEYYEYDFANRVTVLNRKLKDNLSGVRNSVAGVWGGTGDDQTFSFSYTYNDAGMVTSMEYPDGSEHTFGYDDHLARLTGISETTFGKTSLEVVTDLQYTNAGVVTDMTYANGVTQHWDFDNRKRISHINISKVSENIEDLTKEYETIEDLVYKLNKSGDILSINENEYEYDGFDRIIGAKTLLPETENDPSKLIAESFGTYQGNDPILNNGEFREYNEFADINPNGADGKINGLDHILASFVDEGTLYDTETFSYDKNGNRTRLEQNGDIYTYNYGGRNRLDSILLKKEDESIAKEFITYKYDANGNLVERNINADDGTVTVVFEYDTMNRLLKTIESGKTTTYYYDNAGNRFIKQESDGELSLYLRHGQIAVAMDIEIPGTEHEFKDKDGNVSTKDEDKYKGKINRYILSGDLVAGRITRTVKMDDSSEYAKSYYHLDHLNSTKLVTNSEGAVESNYTYRAFGEQLNELQDIDAKYTYGGKELDSNTNLYYFNARYYDATIGRFINVDPIQDGTNWYVYCSNNPMSMVDPTGLEDAVSTTFKMVGKVMGKVAVNIIVDYAKYKIRKKVQDVHDTVFYLPNHMNFVIFQVENNTKNRIRNEFVKATGYCYGNFGGPGWTGGNSGEELPINDMDRMFEAHDLGYEAAKNYLEQTDNKEVFDSMIYEADKVLVDALMTLPDDVSKWNWAEGEGPKDSTSDTLYKHQAAFFFSEKLGNLSKEQLNFNAKGLGLMASESYLNLKGANNND